MRLKKKLNLFIFNSKQKKWIHTIVFISIFLIIESFVGKFLEPVQKTVFYPKIRYEQFYSNNEKIDLLFLGASHAYRSFDPEIFDKKLNINSFNLGSSSQNPIDSYYVLKEAIKYNKPKMVIYEITWLAFEGEDYNFDSATYNYDYMKSFTNKIEYLVNGFKPDQFIKANMFSVRYHYNWKKWENIKQNFINRYMNNNNTPDIHMVKNNEFYKDKGFVYSNINNNTRGLNEKNQFNDYNGYDFNKKRFDCFSNIINLCNKNDIELVFVTTPLPTNSIAKIYDYWEIHKLFDSYAKEKGIHYFDYNLIKSDAILFNNNYFKDDNHLNGEGAELISNHLSDYILNNTNEKLDILKTQFCSSEKEFFEKNIEGILSIAKTRNLYLVNIESIKLEYIKILENNVIELDDDLLYKTKFTDSDVIVIKENKANNKFLTQELKKIYRFYQKYEDYYMFYNNYDNTVDSYNNIRPDYEHYFENWLGPKKINITKSNDFKEVIPPLFIQGLRENFIIEKINANNGELIHIEPTNISNNQHIIQLGYDFVKDLNIKYKSNQRITFIIKARVNNKSASLFIQDFVENWEQTSTQIDSSLWKEYYVQKTIREDSKEIGLGIIWTPHNDDWLEIKDVRIYVE